MYTQAACLSCQLSNTIIEFLAKRSYIYLKNNFILATVAASRQSQSDGSHHQPHQQSYLQKKIRVTDDSVYLPTLLIQLVCHL
uniref:Uncharacterized protein n=1 Tax=Arundo donax TaxID=35708 RepID=A0A0A9AWC0_ARUDO